MRDAKYSNIEAEKIHSTRIESTEIRTERLLLNDKCIVSDINLAGTRVKQLYEAQQNTNTFTDANKETLENLDKTITKKDEIVIVNFPTFQKFHAMNVDVPTSSFAYCIDTDGNVFMKANTNGVIKWAIVPLSEPKINVTFDVGEDVEVHMNEIIHNV